MSLAIATFRGVLWNHGGKVIEYSLMYAASLVVARGLGVEANGVYASVISLSQLLLVLTSFGFETVINKNFPQISGGEADAQRSYLLRRIVAIRCAVFMAGGVLLAAVSSIVPGLAGPARGLIFVIIAFTFSRALVPLLAMTLTAEMRTDVTAWINVGSRAFELAVFGWKSASGLTLPFVLVTLLVSGFMQLGAYLMVSRRAFLRPVIAVSVRPLLAFGGIFWIYALVDYVLGRHGDVFMLSHLLSDPSYASLYDVAYSALQLAQLGATAGLAGVTFAAFAQLAVQAPESMPPFYHFLVRTVTLLTVPLFAFLLFNADLFMGALYGGAYAGAARLIQGMAVFRILSRLCGGGENAEFMLSVGGVKRLLGVGLLSATCNIVLNLVLVPTLAAEGSVIASGSANLAANALGFLLLGGRVRLQAGFWAKVTVLGAALSFAVMWIETSSLLLTLAVRFCLYFLLIVVAFSQLRIVSPGDRERIRDAIRGLGRGSASGERVQG